GRWKSMATSAVHSCQRFAGRRLQVARALRARISPAEQTHAKAKNGNHPDQKVSGAWHSFQHTKPQVGSEELLRSEQKRDRTCARSFLRFDFLLRSYRPVEFHPRSVVELERRDGAGF